MLCVISVSVGVIDGEKTYYRIHNENKRIKSNYIAGVHSVMKNLILLPNIYDPKNVDILD